MSLGLYLANSSVQLCMESDFFTLWSDCVTLRTSGAPAFSSSGKILLLHTPPIFGDADLFGLSQDGQGIMDADCVILLFCDAEAYPKSVILEDWLHYVT